MKTQENMYVVRSLSDDYIENIADKIFLQQEIITDYIDWDSLQSFRSFSEKNDVKFLANDFCIQAPKEVFNRLKKEGRIHLEEVNRLGRFSKEKHGRAWDLFKSLNHITVQEMNQYSNFVVGSFSQFKANIRTSLETNILSGGLSVAFYSKTEEYKKFLSKIDWSEESRWKIDINSTKDKDGSDIEILLQLFLFQNNRDKKIFTSLENIIDNNRINHFKICNEILSYSLDFLSSESFSKHTYLTYICDNLDRFAKNKKNDNLLVEKIEHLIIELRDFIQKEIHEGLTYNSTKKSRLFIILQDFIRLSDSDLNKLKELKNKERYYPSTFFLLGMIHTYTRIKNIFPQQLTQYIISVSAYRVIDFKFRENNIYIIFNSSEDSSVWDSKFKFVKEQFDQFKEIMTFEDQVQKNKENYIISKEKMKSINEKYERKINIEEGMLHKNKLSVRKLEKEVEDIIDKRNRLTIEKSDIEKGGKVVMWASLKHINNRKIFTENLKNISQEDFQHLCKDFYEDTNIMLQKNKTDNKYSSRATGGLKSNKDTIIDYCFKDESIANTTHSNLNQNKKNHLSKERIEYIEKSMKLSEEDRVKDKKELRYTNENKEIINKDSQYEDLSFSDLSQNEKNQLSNFNLKTNTNHRIYTDHSTKEKFIVVDGEKVIVGDKNK
jgi:hypothetical protein